MKSRFSRICLTNTLAMQPGLFFIVLIFLIFSISCFAQKKINVNGISVTYNVPDDMTPDMAKQKAIEDAKRKALQTAGVGETVSMADVLSTASGTTANQYKQVFNTFSTSEIQGDVLSYNITSYNKTTDQFGNFVINLTMDAVVTKYEVKRDLAFDIKVDGIHDSYNNKEALSFTFTAYQPGFLRIFVMGDGDNQYILFPNNYETQYNFKKGDVINFPVNKGISYSMETDKQQEYNNIVFVYTKQDVPFTQNSDNKGILSFIYSIPPDQRVVKYFPVLIKSNP